MAPSCNANSGPSGSGCFSGLARLLLCKGRHQTHPSDQINEEYLPGTNQLVLDHHKQKKEAERKVQAPGGGTPGLVARLMGLDSLPDSNWIPKVHTPGSVTRSRSVNFMDYLLEFDVGSAQHRRVRTSVSFREVPPSLASQQDNDFLMFYMDNTEKGHKEMGSKLKKAAEEGLEDKKRKKKKQNEKKSKSHEDSTEESVTMKKKNQQNGMKIMKLRDEPRRVSNNKQLSRRQRSCEAAEVSSASISTSKKNALTKSGDQAVKSTRSSVELTNQKEVLTESMFMKKIKNHKAISDAESESSSVDSSLSFDQFLNEIEIPLTGCTRCKHFNSRRKSSSTVANSCPQSPNPIFASEAGDLEPKTLKTLDTESYIQLLRKLWTLAEEEIKGSKWMGQNKFEFEDIEEICLDFGRQILDLLLQQVVEELVGFQVDKSIEVQ